MEKIDRGPLKLVYRISTNEHGDILLKKRKIAKAFRRWLRENGFSYNSTYFYN